MQIHRHQTDRKHFDSFDFVSLYLLLSFTRSAATLAFYAARREEKEDEGNLDKWRIIAETFLTFCSLIGVALRMSGRAAERRRLTEEQED